MSGGEHEQNPRVVVTILITNADNTTMQHGDLHNSDLLRRCCIMMRPNGTSSYILFRNDMVFTSTHETRKNSASEHQFVDHTVSSHVGVVLMIYTVVGNGGVTASIIKPSVQSIINCLNRLKVVLNKTICTRSNIPLTHIAMKAKQPSVHGQCDIIAHQI